MVESFEAEASVALPADLAERLAQVAATEHLGILNLPTDDPLDPKRRRRVEATRSELFAQPSAIEATLIANEEALALAAHAVASREPKRIFLVGAGDSLAVAMAARYAFEAMLGIPCDAVQSLEFAHYYSLIPPDSLVVTLSSSGETTRTVEAMLVAQAAGAATVAVTNTPTSTLAELSDATLEVLATRVGWPTQSSTAALALLLQLGVTLSRLGEVAGADRWTREAAALPDLMTQALVSIDGAVAEIAERERAATMYLFSGGGPNFASAVVGAAKVKECTPDHALAIQVEEYHHYNSQKAGEPLWLLAPSGRTVARAVDTAQEARRFGGQVYVATTEGERAFDDLADAVVFLPPTPELLSPLLYFLPAQLMGYHAAMAKFAEAEAEAEVDSDAGRPGPSRGTAVIEAVQ